MSLQNSANYRDSGIIMDYQKVREASDNAEPGAPLPFKSGWRIWIVSLLIAISSFMFGYCMSALNQPFADKKGNPGSIFWDIQLTVDEQEYATSSLVLGAWLGCSVVGMFVQQWGLKTVILWNNIFFFAGCTMCGFTSSLSLLIVGRFIMGIGVGIESGAVPVLLAEISPTELRGTITVFHQMELVIGILVATLVGFGFVKYVNHGWRYVQLLPMSLVLLQTMCHSMIPESPRWLMRNGYKERCRGELIKLRQGEDNGNLQMTFDEKIDDEIKQIEDALKEEKGDIDADGDENIDTNASWKEVFRVRKPIFIGIALMIFQPFSGINAVIFYSTKVFNIAGVTNDLLSSVLAMSTNVLATIVAMYLIDRLGRKTLLLTGTYIMVISLVVQGLALLMMNDNKSLQGIIAVAATLIYILGFAVGMGAVGWTVLTELVSGKVRAKAFSLFVAVSWACNLIIGLFTLTAIEYLGGGNAKTDLQCKDKAFPLLSETACADEKKGVAILFLIFGGISFCAVVFIHMFIPRTKGLSLEQLASLMGYDTEKKNRSPAF